MLNYTIINAEGLIAATVRRDYEKTNVEDLLPGDVTLVISWKGGRATGPDEVLVLSSTKLERGVSLKFLLPDSTLGWDEPEPHRLVFRAEQA
jgi:hypothetical protein